MKPVDDFYLLMDQRTQQAIDLARDGQRDAQWLTGVMMLVNLLGLMLALGYVYRHLLVLLGGEPAQVVEIVRQIAAGDLSAASASQAPYRQPAGPCSRHAAVAAHHGVHDSGQDTDLQQASATLSGATRNIGKVAESQTHSTTSMASSMEKLTASIGQISVRASNMSELSSEFGQHSSNSLRSSTRCVRLARFPPSPISLHRR